MIINKHSIKLTIIIIIALFLLVLSIMIYNNNQKIDFVKWGADYPIYHSLEDLEGKSDLIIIGSIMSQKNHITKNDTGIVEEGYTLSDFKIERMISQNINSEIPEQITVIEPYFVNKLSLPEQLALSTGKQIITMEEYEPMEENNKYLLFLKFVEENNEYAIIGLHQGSYQIDNKHIGLNYEGEEQGSKTESQLKELVMDKYKKEIEESLQ